jgi:Pyruvate/2-oxoacid:ferredoxin oxidoreductase delta subunit
MLTLKERVTTFHEIAGGMDSERMAAEVSRCFKCGTCTECDLCFLLCPDISITKEGAGYGVRKDYCKGCGICATTCPRHIIEMSDAAPQAPNSAHGAREGEARSALPGEGATQAPFNGGGR